MTMSEDLERLLREYLDVSKLSERVARLEERARIEDRLEDFKTQSGSWDLQALQAAAIAQQRKKSSIPPAIRVVSTIMDSAWGKIGSLAAAGVLTWVIDHLPAILKALH